MIGRLLASRRAKLLGVLVVATLAITGLAVSAAGDSMSYYATPEEFAKQLEDDMRRWGDLIRDARIVLLHRDADAFAEIAALGERPATKCATPFGVGAVQPDRQRHGGQLCPDQIQGNGLLIIDGKQNADQQHYQ